MFPKTHLALVLLALAGAAQAQAPATPPEPPAIVTEQPAGIPPALQARIEAAEARDYRAERMALVKKPTFNGYAAAIREQALMDEWLALLDGGKASVQEQEAKLLAMVEELPLSYPVNSAAARWYADRYEASTPRDPLLLEQGRPYYIALEGIIESILGSGDGRSQDTAWQVIHIGEEYLVLAYLEYEREDQALVFGTDGRAFDRFTVKDAEGKARTVFFDVSSFFGKRAD